MEKINKRDFIKHVAKKNDIPHARVLEVYDAIVNGIFDMVVMDKRVSLAGFGSFYLQKHKGHPVQFEAKNAGVDDYVVFKFSTSDALNKKMRRLHAELSNMNATSCHKNRIASR